MRRLTRGGLRHAESTLPINHFAARHAPATVYAPASSMLRGTKTKSSPLPCALRSTSPPGVPTSLHAQRSRGGGAGAGGGGGSGQTACVSCRPSQAR